MGMIEPVGVAVIGARAYTAGELLKILVRHPAARVVALQARVEQPTPVAEVFGDLRGYVLPRIEEIDIEALPPHTQVAFLCLPHTVAGQFAARLIERGIRVIDLSSDFRFRDIATYEATYKVEHPAKELNRRAVYGIPELFRASIIGATLIANPGCYATSVILGLAPLMKGDMIDVGSIVADCKSGVSGAGRTPTETTHFCFANENFSAYKVAAHRHQPEIEEVLSRLAGAPRTITFVPHLLPMDRGILSTIYSKLREPLDEDAVRQKYDDFYRNEPFLRILPKGTLPTTKNVSHTNFVDIQVVVDKKAQRLITLVAEDNLVKGASGQAVQNMNVSFGLPETLGLM